MEKDKNQKKTNRPRRRDAKAPEQKVRSKEKLSKEKQAKNSISDTVLDFLIGTPKVSKSRHEPVKDMKTMEHENAAQHKSPEPKKNREEKKQEKTKHREEKKQEKTKSEEISLVDPVDRMMMHRSKNRSDIMFHGSWGADAIYPVDLAATMAVQKCSAANNMFCRGGIMTTTNGLTYLILEAYGKTSFKVQNMISKANYFLKIQSSGMPANGPKIKRWNMILDVTKKVPESCSKHFPRIVESSAVPDPAIYIIVTELLGPNLDDYRSNAGLEFDTESAFRFCLETLKCLQDVHMMGYAMRDVQPKRFSLGLGSKSATVLMNSFSYVQEYPPHKTDEYMWFMTKFPWMNHKFVPRVFHTKDYYKLSDDIESWIYMCYDFFDSHSLPWGRPGERTERDIYIQKKLFFTGFYDGTLDDGTIHGYVLKRLKVLRELRSEDVHPFFIDYASYAFALKQIAKDMGIKLSADSKFGFKKRLEPNKSRPVQQQSSQAECDKNKSVKKSAQTILLSKNLPPSPQPKLTSGLKSKAVVDDPYYSAKNAENSPTAKSPMREYTAESGDESSSTDDESVQTASPSTTSTEN